MGVLSRLSEGVRLSLRDIVTLMIIVSDNTATNLVIGQVGLENINGLCTRLGAKNTTLGRRMMDLEARERGLDNFTSASEVVLFLRELAEGTLIKEKLRMEMLQILQGQQFNTKLPARISRVVPGDPVMAHKTGELPGLEHDAGIFKYQGSYAYVAGLFHDLKDNLEGQQALAAVGFAVHSYLMG